MPELLPCPKCHSTNVDYTWKSTSNGLKFELTCKGCAIKYIQRFLRVPREKAEELFITAWNTRAPRWLPIAECPDKWKDGREVLLYAYLFYLDEREAKWQIGQWHAKDQEYGVDGFYTEDGGSLTAICVMPLPDGPGVVC